MRDGMLEKYLRMFANLRTDKNRKRWSALTCFQAPHKPFVLLSVMDLIAQGQITKNFIEPSLELVEIFNLYWARIMPVRTKGNMAYPFPRLKNDGFWNLVPNRLFTTEAQRTRRRFSFFRLSGDTDRRKYALKMV